MCGGGAVSDEFQTERKRRKIEVKVGSGTLIVEESELDNLIDALSDMRKTATDGNALMHLGSS
jgi:hypothetical protein